MIFVGRRNKEGTSAGFGPLERRRAAFNLTFAPGLIKPVNESFFVFADSFQRSQAALNLCGFWFFASGKSRENTSSEWQRTRYSFEDFSGRNFTIA